MSLQKFPSIEADLQTLNEESTAKIEQKYTLVERAKIIFSNITVEPIMTFYILPCVMSSLACQNLSLEKACRVNLEMDEKICDALSSRNVSGYKEEDEIQVQKTVAFMTAWKSLICSVIPVMFLLYIGSWSDRHNRRKPLMLIPIVGEMIATLGLIVCTFFFYELPMEVNAVTEALPGSLAGGWCTMSIGVYSYVSQNSSPETRTVKIGALSLFANISITTGTAIGGYMYNGIGFYGVFSLTVAMYVIGLIYGHTTVKDEPIIQEVKKNPVKDFFDPNHIKDTLKVAFKKGGNNRKTKICTIMVLVMVIVGPLHGEMQVMYLFTRYKYKWDEIEFSIFSTYNTVVHMVGTVFSLLFFSKYLKIDDSLLGIISCASKILSSFIYAFAPNSTVFYLAVIVEMFNGTSFIAMRSIVSKLVNADELGKINSVFGLCESLMPVVYGPMYSIVYRSTIDVFPGLFFILGGLLTLPAVFIFFWMYVDDRRSLREEKIEQEEGMLGNGNKLPDERGESEADQES